MPAYGLWGIKQNEALSLDSLAMHYDWQKKPTSVVYECGSITWFAKPLWKNQAVLHILNIMDTWPSVLAFNFWQKAILRNFCDVIQLLIH